MNEEYQGILQPAPPSIEFPRVQTPQKLQTRKRREITSRRIPVKVLPREDIPQVSLPMTYNYYEGYHSNIPSTSSSALQLECSIPSAALAMLLNIHYTLIMTTQQTHTSFSEISEATPFQYTIPAFSASTVCFGTRDGSTSHARHSFNDFFEMMTVPEQ
ncbi:hypothetical protein JCGZ_13207 [Jatropha curcas]|uniref:Uncharacterized protein n=1 Tax=Jatropha curcas TaxID=180498 RepID=A0A067K873_JATCU|nr:hypothetical protein JCGZ_13207 [Jatropha curcas]